jgi:predicted membrane chloride channel (bestrophin family)
MLVVDPTLPKNSLVISQLLPTTLACFLFTLAIYFILNYFKPLSIIVILSTYRLDYFQSGF